MPILRLYNNDGNIPFQTKSQNEDTFRMNWCSFFLELNLRLSILEGNAISMTRAITKNAVIAQYPIIVLPSPSRGSKPM